MTLGPTAFAVVLWGAVLAVLGIFGYVAYALLVDAGVLPARRRERRTG